MMMSSSKKSETSKSGPWWGEQSEALDKEKMECKHCREWKIPRKGTDIFTMLYVKQRRSNPSVITLYDWDRRVKHFVCPVHGIMGREPVT